VIAYAVAVASDAIISNFCDRSQYRKSLVHGWHKSRSSSFCTLSSPAMNFKTEKLLVIVLPQRLQRIVVSRKCNIV
jgi:hypothetical protein